MEEGSKTQQELNKALYARQRIDSQLQETQMVISEISSIEDDQIIYKSFGPALLVQEKDEALSVLRKRSDFIKNELKSLDFSIENMDKKLNRKISQK